MPETFSLAAAFAAGLLGGVHCLGMCGGIVSALTLGLETGPQPGHRSLWSFLLAYNAGRVLSYVVAGGIMGGVGALVVSLAPVQAVQQGLLAVAGIFMILLGLYLGGWWRVLTRVEHLGAALWRRVEPLGRRFIPVRSVDQAFAVGLVWGWIPCGLVYTMLIWAVASGGVVEGMGLMLAFGAGTLPNLLAMGLLAGALAPQLRRPWVRWAAGAVLVIFGALTLWRAF